MIRPAVIALVVALGVQAAWADEAVTAIPAPAARLGAAEACRIVTPTFDPRRERVRAPEAARFVGGAKRFDLVAAPCRARAVGVDV